MQHITNTTTSVTRVPSQEPPPLRRRWRFIRIFWWFLRAILHVFFFDLFLGRWWFSRRYVKRTAMTRWVRLARSFRYLALDMGGVLIKLGQFLSARADILPEPITAELSGLQDEVPPAPLPYVIAIFEAELGAPPEQVFKHFDPTPVAAASFGQVYYAELHDGSAVAVKVQRPRIDEIVEVDLRAVHWAVQIIKNYPAIKRRAKLDELFVEFARVLREELDYVQEARNAEQVRANLAHLSGVTVPVPDAQLTTRRVLVMERISGIKISDLAAIEQAGINRGVLAQRFYRAYLQQWFIDGVFHADPHPGNLFVRPEGPGPDGSTEFTLIFIDFGMVGRMTPKMRTTLREAAIAIATNDPERLVSTLEALDMILPGADRQPILRAAEVLFSHTYDRNLREMQNIDVQGVFDEVGDLVRELPFQMPQDLIYLGRSVSMVSGMTTMIDPEINIFETLRPFAKTLIADEQGVGEWAKRIQHELSDLAQLSLTLPRQLDSYLRTASRGELRVRVDLSRLERGMQRMERATARLTSALMMVGLFGGGVVLRIYGFSTEAFGAWGLAILVLLWTLWPRFDK